MSPREVQVLVVGAGPSGAMAALLLEQLGVETEIIDRREGPKPAPAAHVVNARTLEICRSSGVDMRALAAAAADPADAGFVYWVTRLGGRVLGRLPYEQQGDDQLRLTPTPLRNIPQNRFEPILLEALERRGNRGPVWRQQWESCVQEGDGVRSVIRDLETGGEREILSRYVIAADGSGSAIRQALGIGFVGPEQLQRFLMVHLRASLRGLPEVPPGVLIFVCDPRSGGGVFVVHDLDQEAVYMHPVDPAHETEADWTPEFCAEKIREALEDPSLEFEVANASDWTMTAQIAERYREGQVFLVGDAAHRFPPTGGLGLNSGVQDVHNLAWKLSAVLHGQAGDGLLDSYEAERRPVAQTNADQSLANALRLFEIPQVLGITDRSEESFGRMEKVLSDRAGLEAVAAAIDHQAEHFDMPGLQLGFCYREGALVRAAEDRVPEVSVREYRPTGCPGARLPHLWLGGADSGRSILDEALIDRFLLVTGPEGRAWIEALDGVQSPATAALCLTDDGIPGLSDWLVLAGIGRQGALLVRPDQHVGWRSAGLVGDPRGELEIAFTTILGR